jgi:hypothetical protein
MFVRALAKDHENPAKALEEYLLDRGWPYDQQFETAFVDFPLYVRGYTKEVLEALEQSHGHKEPADLTAAQVEHILPQTLNQQWIDALGPEVKKIQAEWLHRPGNLTLSGYNQELWNHSFPTKRERYAQSNIVITRELTDYDSWTAAEVRPPSIDVMKVRDLREKGLGASDIAKALKIGRASVYRALDAS